MTELVPLLAAEIDIQQAYDYYEEFREGLGAVFMHRLDEAFGQLRVFPESGPVVHGVYRRLLVPGFPFGIFYTVEPRGVIVAGVMDTRQNPETILRRLS
jgi:plasmid stabilization system protein ParE